MRSAQVVVSKQPAPAFDMLHHLQLSKSLNRKLKIPVSSSIFLHCGHKVLEVACTINDKLKTSHMHVHPELLHMFGLPDQTPLHMSYSAYNKTIRLGPVLAILVHQRSDPHPAKHQLNHFLQEFSQCAAAKHVFSYVVYLQDLLQEQELVTGWIFKDSQWISRQFPSPNVIYNRISSRKIEGTASFKKLINQLVNKQTTFFNRSFLNKWEVYQYIKDQQALQHTLPETQRFTRFSSLESMMLKYPAVYAKPINGSLGIGIYRISRNMKGYMCQHSSRSTQPNKSFASSQSLYNYLKKRGTARGYIIQQGIPLLHVQDKPVDFRVLMHKNRQGTWSVTSMVARLGQAHRFVSNIAQGGELQSVLHTLKMARVPHPNEKKKELVLIAKHICQIIESNREDQFGELGIDLAITAAGHIYLLEVNSKPSKEDNTILDKRERLKHVRPSVRQLLQYTLFSYETRIKEGVHSVII